MANFEFAKLGVAFATLLWVGTSAANAVTMKLDFIGKVSNSSNFDIYDTFGTGGNLAGQSATISFLFNANPGDSYLTGNVPANVYSMSLTINGNTFTTQKGVNGVPDFGASGYALRNDIYNVLVGSGDVTYSTPQSTFNRTGLYGGPIYGTFFSPDLTTPFNVTGLNCMACGSFVAYRVLGTGTDYFLGNLDVSAARLSPVPLPAALPLMASALGALGLAARRRRKSKQTA
jgi:hypothetical protein